MAGLETARLAVLVDADNTSPKHAEALLEEVAKYGVPTVKRAYGDWTNPHLSGWLSVLPKHGVQPMLQIAHTRGKNSTDSALIIDAMDLLYSGNVDAFALVSSDSDFTSLAIRLRASGRTVYGLGLRKTPEALRQAVDRFIYLEDLHEAPADDADEDAEAPEQRRIPDLRRLLERAVDATSDDDGWSGLSAVRNQITRVEPSFSYKDYGAAKMGDLVRAQPYLEVEPGENGPRVRRIADTKPAKKTATKKTATRKATTRKAAPQEAGPQEAAPQAETAEKPAAPKVTTPKVTTRKRSAPRTTSGG